MMNADDTQRDPLEALADEFTQRCRRGEQPSIEAYAAQHPELADDIRDLFSTIREVEQAKGAMTATGPARAVIGPTIERLGDFRIIRELGYGGMGIVYEAEQESLGRRVAIKVLPHLYLRSPSRRERFEREARTAARLHHTNIVPVFGVGEQDGHPYFVMQYIRGVGLDAVFEHLHALHTQLSRTPKAANGSAAAFDFAAVAKSLMGSLNAESGTRNEGRESTPTGAGGTQSLTETREGMPATEDAGKDSCTSGSRTGDMRTTGDGESNRQSEIGNRQSSPCSPCLRGDNSPRPLTLAYWRRLALLIAEAADALAYAHAQGVLHRDVKPANLLLDADGTLWVTDFGLAKAMQDSSPDLTREGDLVGTLRYMSPEQFSHRGDERSDVYGLGITLYELATLQPAFTERDRPALTRAVMDHTLWPPRRLCPSMPRDLETIIEKATAREAAHRYPSAAALRDDLLCFADDRPIAARRLSIPERMWRWSRRNPALAATSGAAFTLLLAVALVASVAYLSVRRANVRAQAALQGETQQRERAQKTADLAVETLETLFNEYAPESPAVSGEFKLDDTESGTVSVSVPPLLSDDTARMLEHMLGVYRDLAEQQGGSRDLRQKVAAAQRRVGEIQERLGQYEAAREAYGRAIEQYETLLDGQSDHDDVLLILVRLREQVGKVLSAQDRLPEATTQFEAAQELLGRYPEPLRSSPQVRFELARVHYLMGLPPGGTLGLQPEMTRPLGPGRPPGAGPRPGDRALGPPVAPAAPERLWPPAGPNQQDLPDLNGRPGRPARGPRLPGREGRGPGPFTREGLGPRPPIPPGERRPFDLEDRPGQAEPPADPGPPPADLPDAQSPPSRPPPPDDSGPDRETLIRQQEHLTQAIEILTELTAASPQTPAYRHLLAQCLRQRRPGPGGPLRPGQRRGDLDRSIELLEGLVEEFPDEPQYLLDLCQAYAAPPPARPGPFAASDPSSLRRGEGPLRPPPRDDADRLEAAVQRMEKLTRERPGIPAYTFALAQLYAGLSRQDREQSLPGRAMQNLRRAVELQAGLIEKFPEVQAYAVAMAVCERDLSQMLMRVGQWEQAKTNASSAVRRLESLADGSNGRPFVRHLLASCYEQLAECLQAAGDDVQARDMQRKAMNHRRPGPSATQPALDRREP